MNISKHDNDGGVVDDGDRDGDGDGDDDDDDDDDDVRRCHDYRLSVIVDCHHRLL